MLRIKATDNTSVGEAVDILRLLHITDESANGTTTLKKSDGSSEV